MSRSTKKPWHTDQQTSSTTKKDKRKANRAIRSKADDEAPANGKAYRKESDSWKIRDWSFHDPKNKKAHRK